MFYTSRVVSRISEPSTVVNQHRRENDRYLLSLKRLSWKVYVVSMKSNINLPGKDHISHQTGWLVKGIFDRSQEGYMFIWPNGS